MSTKELSLLAHPEDISGGDLHRTAKDTTVPLILLGELVGLEERLQPKDVRGKMWESRSFVEDGVDVGVRRAKEVVAEEDTKVEDGLHL